MINTKTIKFLDNQSRELIISDFNTDLTKYNSYDAGIDLKTPAPKTDVVKTPGSDFAQIANISYAGRFVRINGRFVDPAKSSRNTRDSITYLKSFERREVSAELYFESDTIENSKQTYTINGIITEVSTFNHNQLDEYKFLVNFFSPTPYFFGQTLINRVSLGTGGRNYKKSYPYAYNPSGTILVTNEGDTFGFMKLRIQGPAKNIQIKNNNQTFELGTVQTPFVIQDNEFIDIDGENQTVISSTNTNLTILSNNIFDVFRVDAKSTLSLQVLADLTDKTTEVTTTLKTPFIQID